VELPAIGTAAGFGGRRDETETFYTFANFSMPSRIYRYDMKSGQSSLFREPKVKFNPDDYVTTQVFYPGQRRREDSDVHHATRRASSSTATTPPCNTAMAASTSR